MEINRLQPIISVVTIVFNGEEYIERTIQSVVGQTYSNIEYIVIDGGSTDGTLGVIKKYEDRISHWRSERDDGVYDAMNKGISLATGHWINFLHGGDEFFETGTIEAIVDRMQNSEKTYFGVANIVGKNASWLYPRESFNSSGITQWLRNHLPNHQTMFFPKCFFERERYDTSFQISGDDDYKYRSLNKCGFEFLDIIVCRFPLGGISSNWKSLTLVKEIGRVNARHRGKIFAIKKQARLLLVIALSFLGDKLLTKLMYIYKTGFSVNVIKTFWKDNSNN